MKQLQDQLNQKVGDWMQLDKREQLIGKLERQKMKLQEFALAFAQKNEQIRIANKTITNLQREKEYLIEVINKLHDEMQVYNQILLEGFTIDPNAIYSDLKRENERLTALVKRLQNEDY